MPTATVSGKRLFPALNMYFNSHRMISLQRCIFKDVVSVSMQHLHKTGMGSLHSLRNRNEIMNTETIIPTLLSVEKQHDINDG